MGPSHVLTSLDPVISLQYPDKMMTFGIIAPSLVFITVLAVILHRLLFHPLSKYPGPLLARCTGWYAVYHAFIGDVHLDMLRCHERYGAVVRYGPNKVIFNSSAAIKDIYSKNAHVQKSTSYRAFETSSTAHDLQSTRDRVEHARKRRTIGQAFSDSALRSLESHILPHVESFVQALSRDAPTADLSAGTWSQAKNIGDWSNYVSFDFMTELVFGKSLSLLRTSEHRYIPTLIHQAAFRVGVCLQMPRLALWKVDALLTPNVRADRDRYVRTSKDMVMERRKMDSGRKDLFSHIIAAEDPLTGKKFSADEMWGESTLLIIAGSDALSTAIASCFFYLSRNREQYDEACREVRAAFSSGAEVRVGNTLNSCRYLRACIDESMRMSPPVGAALWKEVLPGGTKIAGEHIAQGCDVGIGIYAIHHNPEYFPDPFLFRPERWIESETQSKESVQAARNAFSAFSAGSDGCIGKNLAYMEATLTLARVLLELDFKVAEESTPTGPSPAYLKPHKLHAKYEYALRDSFTSLKDGPMITFKRRTLL